MYVLKGAAGQGAILLRPLLSYRLRLQPTEPKDPKSLRAPNSPAGCGRGLNGEPDLLRGLVFVVLKVRKVYLQNDRV